MRVIHDAGIPGTNGLIGQLPGQRRHQNPNLRRRFQRPGHGAESRQPLGSAGHGQQGRNPPAIRGQPAGRFAHVDIKFLLFGNSHQGHIRRQFGFVERLGAGAQRQDEHVVVTAQCLGHSGDALAPARLQLNNVIRNHVDQYRLGGGVDPMLNPVDSKTQAAAAQVLFPLLRAQTGPHGIPTRIFPFGPSRTRARAFRRGRGRQNAFNRPCKSDSIQLEIHDHPDGRSRLSPCPNQSGCLLINQNRAKAKPR